MKTLLLLLLAFTTARIVAADCIELPRENGSRVWVYLPDAAKQGERLPCVLVPPAGSRLYHGIRMTESDRAEHWPYVGRGFVVISFDISGELDDASDRNLCRIALQKFLAADCGLLDARSALAIACKRFPQIDLRRVYVAGHSSAATLALQIASSDLGVKACVAMAPIGDLYERFSTSSHRWLDSLVPGSSAQLVSHSPIRQVSKIRCPVFLFHALDDDNVRPETVVRLKKALVEQAVALKYVPTAHGGHYDSMIQVGLPAAVLWLLELDKNSNAPNPSPKLPR